jgi:3'-phosphoadenosine 5'-phosphosulfate sulfotransferase (PAPS reductase)/FAD synthetase
LKPVRPEPVDWNTWLKTWEVHAESRALERKVLLAVETIKDAAARQPNRYVGVSGGKDSVAVAGLVRDAGFIAAFPLVHCSTPIDTPGSLETVNQLADRLDMDLDIVDPDDDVWLWLESLPANYDLLGDGYVAFLHRFSAVNLSIAYCYEQEREGVFLGLRTEESKGRTINRMVRGKDYQLRDGTWTCQPIVDWSARDVFGYAVMMDLPIHPYYRLALERMGISPESPQSRVGCMLPEDCVTTWPVLHPMRVMYPELWRHIVKIRPELINRS